jgi:hypothetical protein
VEPFAIRVTTPDELFDAYSAAPLENRPLSDEVRSRILAAWIDTRDERPSHLSVELPPDQREEHLASRIEEAIRYDFVETTDAARRLHVFTRSERREAAVAFLFLIGCVLGATLVDQVTKNDAFFTSLSQGLVVLGWVAMWQPAQQVFTAISRRLSYQRYRELSEVPIEVRFV